MKKLCVIFALSAVLALCSCSSEPEQAPPHTAGVLYFSNESKDYAGCATRAQEVVTALTEKVDMLIDKNNAAVESRVPIKFFLEQDYILTNFSPFMSDYFAYTLKFSDDAAENGSIDTFTDFGEDTSVLFEETDKNVYRLTVEGGNGAYKLSGEYSRKNNSLSYNRVAFDEESEDLTEFLDFVYVKDSGYYIQNSRERCVINFDENGAVLSIDYSCLAAEEKSYEIENDSIFPDAKSATETLPSRWTAGGDKDRYSCIYSYSGGTLTYEDCSSGEWKTVKISE